MLISHMRTLAHIPLPVQLLANVLEKAAEDDPSIWVPHEETRRSFRLLPSALHSPGHHGHLETKLADESQQSDYWNSKEFGRVAGYKSSEHKSMSLVYINNSMVEKEPVKIVPFKIAESILKCRGINLTKDMEDLSNGNYKTFKNKKKRKDIKRRNLP